MYLVLASITDPIVNFAVGVVGDLGLVGVFVLMVLESACIPIPSEATMLFAGFNVAEGEYSLFLAVAVASVANLVGSWIAYAAGRLYGRELLDRYGKYILIRSHDIDRAEVWWDKYGEAATFFSRLLPVIRTFISLPAGIARMPFAKFTLYTFLGVVPWTFGLAYLGVIVKDNWEKALGYFNGPTFVIAGLLVVGAVLWYLRRRRNRRLVSDPPSDRR